MSTYVTIDGRSYYSLCSKCKDKSCYSCVIQKYQEDLKSEKDKRISSEWCIEHELEPRIKAEKIILWFLVKEDTGIREYKDFCNQLDEMVSMVEDNEIYFEWDDKDGDLYEKVLDLIKEYIKERNQIVEDYRWFIQVILQN